MATVAVFDNSLLLLIVVFQPEIRRVLEQMGRTSIFSLGIFQKKTMEDIEIDELKNYASKFLPQAMNTPEAFKTVVESLSKTIPTINAYLMPSLFNAGI